MLQVEPESASVHCFTYNILGVQFHKKFYKVPNSLKSMHFSWCFDFSLRFFHLFIKEDSHYSHLVADPQYTYLVKSTKMCEKKGNPRTMSRPTLAFVVKKGRNDYLKGGDLRVLIKSRRNFMDGIAAV